MRSLKLLVTCMLLTTATQVNAEKKLSPETVFGKIFSDETSRPLKDVTITAVLLNKKEKYTISDVDGGYGLSELKPGVYKIIFEKDGYRKVVKDKVTIKANTQIELNIEMEQSLYFDLAPSPLHFFQAE
ncbi:MAG TPA: carboxypeptidase-like regulatory domain-containing protein [Chitinophagaceae bacterium]|nr:carboxypeptidase-like regulatory domain-containing protein [Chitinophagaceae bacterium]